MIPFNIPAILGNELKYIQESLYKYSLCGDGMFTKECNVLLQAQTQTSKCLLTTSCTHALEMSAFLCEIAPGDEVIMPSYTFVSTANAFAMRGAKVIFVDIRPDTMNIDEKLIEDAISPQTKAIIPVHYAGVGCEMDEILNIGQKYNLFVIEDAAQGIDAYYKGKALGGIGDFGCISFHETKNVCMGEGGAILCRDNKYGLHAEIIREKGTNRTSFYRGEVDKYSWQDLGSSYLPSDILAGYLLAQLQNVKKITEKRKTLWNLYFEGLRDLVDKEYIELQYIPEYCEHNGHMFYIKTQNQKIRNDLIEYLKENGILAVSHYVPLHSAPAGLKYGRFHGEDKYTTKESSRLCRLPLYYSLNVTQVEMIIEKVQSFFVSKSI